MRQKLNENTNTRKHIGKGQTGVKAHDDSITQAIVKFG